MASTASLSIVSELGGKQLLCTDTGSYTAPVTSRTLTIYDANNVLIVQYIMNSATTQIFAVTADGYYIFVLAVTDATGVVPPATVNYYANGIYQALYTNTISQTGCGCDCDNNTLIYADIAEIYNIAGLRLAVGGFGPAAQNAITAANAIISGT